MPFRSIRANWSEFWGFDSRIALKVSKRTVDILLDVNTMEADLKTEEKGSCPGYNFETTQ